MEVTSQICMNQNSKQEVVSLLPGSGRRKRNECDARTKCSSSFRAEGREMERVIKKVQKGPTINTGLYGC